MIALVFSLTLAIHTLEQVPDACKPTLHGGTQGRCPTVKMGEAQYWTMVGEGDTIILDRFPVVSGKGDMRAAKWPRYIELRPEELIEGGLVLRVVKLVGGGWQTPPGADTIGPQAKQIRPHRAILLIPKDMDHRVVALVLVIVMGSAARIRHWWRDRPKKNRRVRAGGCPGCPVCADRRAA